MSGRARVRGRPLITNRTTIDRTRARILSVDGGGIRGIIAARVLEEIERLSGKRICELFDLVAGTSTGGIIALALTIPGPDSTVRTARSVVKLYEEKGARIFSSSLGHSLGALWGLTGPKYPATGIEEVLKEEFGESSRLSSAVTPVLVASYDLTAAAPYFFKSYRRATSPDGGSIPDDYLAWQAARATAAAPTYFPPYLLRALGVETKDKWLIDGGVFANNPTLCAVADANRMFPGVSERIAVSLGTGADDLHGLIHGMWGGGVVSWARPILSIVLDGTSDTVDYEAEELVTRHVRLQKPDVQTSMDDVSRRSIARLLEEAESLITDNSGGLKALVEELSIPPPGGRADSV